MLWLQEVHTDSLSVNRIWFDTRVQGSYFYMYPRDKEGGEILEHYPYTGGIVDAIDLLEAVPQLGITTEQRLDRYSEKTYQLAVEYDILSGITYTGVKQINYSGRFKPGHIYFIILGELQGGIVNRAYYRFVYNPADHTQEVALIWRDPYWTETPDQVGDD